MKIVKHIIIIIRRTSATHPSPPYATESVLMLLTSFTSHTSLMHFLFFFTHSPPFSPLHTALPILSRHPLLSLTLSISLSTHNVVIQISSALHLFKLRGSYQCFLFSSHISFPTHFTTHLSPDIIGHPGLSSSARPLMTIIEGQGRVGG